VCAAFRSINGLRGAGGWRVYYARCRRALTDKVKMRASRVKHRLFPPDSGFPFCDYITSVQMCGVAPATPLPLHGSSSLSLSPRAAAAPDHNSTYVDGLRNRSRNNTYSIGGYYAYYILLLLLLLYYYDAAGGLNVWFLERLRGFVNRFTNIITSISIRCGPQKLVSVISDYNNIILWMDIFCRLVKLYYYIFTLTNLFLSANYITYITFWRIRAIVANTIYFVLVVPPIRSWTHDTVLVIQTFWLEWTVLVQYICHFCTHATTWLLNGRC